MSWRETGESCTQRKEVHLEPRNITRLVLADDNTKFRQYVKTLLDNEPGLNVVGEAEDGRVAIQLVRELEPDVVIMDVIMPEVDGIEATREIVASHPDVRVLALSLHADRRFVEAMRGAGATGYLLKDDSITELCFAIRTVVGGQTYFSPEMDVTA